MENLCCIKRRRANGANPQANIGLLLEAARTLNQTAIDIESESNADLPEDVT